MSLDRMIVPIIALPRGLKRAAAMVVDSCLAVLTVWLAFYLRLGYWVALSDRGWQAAVLALIAIPIFYLFGVYRTVFRHGSHSVVPVIAPATLVYGFIYSSILTAVVIDGVPRTIGFIQPALFLILVAVSRSVVHFMLGGGYLRLTTAGRERAKVLVYGAGSAGRQIASALAESTFFRAVGFIDDDPNLHGSIIGGLRVWPRAQMGAVAVREGVDEVFLAIPSADRRRRNEIIDAIRHEGLATRTLPGILDIAHGSVTISDLKPLEIDDLLGRDAVAPMSDLLERDIRNKRVLVTGAGGSIGSELCRQIVRACPSTLLLFDVNEYALYAIHQEMAGIDCARPPRLIPLLGSVTDAVRLDDIFATWKPQTVYHAAAYKHVPLVEHNPLEGVRNNVLGTWHTASTALRHHTESFVLISTDKAVRPTNIMGASKRMAEMLLQALANDQPSTRFSMVRFGNVLGSSGSVVPLFRKQLAMGGPLTVTHPDIIRYFMTIPEAAQLVLQAGAMGTGGEVFVLDMGEPVRIYDLAIRMIQLAGLQPRVAASDGGDVEIVFTGLRPGEKLYEELLIGDSPKSTRHPRVMVANERHLTLEEIHLLLDQLGEALRQRDVTSLLDVLTRAVEEFKPTSTIVDWITIAGSELRAQ
ncbi:polysaccharide biosynthesis protein [Sphingomonas sp. 8AM]|uniref:polysaccharide biosynthesis protein n=1 Tax=Sphingomonas sp. 8AM TaxID=2653170 RepID=UPI0012F01D22|nr:nucleoside-diphosphate sugar epimerase/dehydratase [Sphingomonas sp. 8AM]VXD01070.1 UDP-N-acetyl-alpha-D-glucosamine C6 dehydratase [Sphingomonas sp. 8AM]